MENNRFTEYNKVKEVLESNGFFGFTCKRGDGRLTYTYRSIHYHCVTVSVVVAKLQPGNINSRKIVLNINVNGKNINGWNDFIQSMKNKWKLHNEEFPKTFKSLGNNGNGKENKHANSHRKPRNVSGRTDGKDIQVVRKETRK